MLSVVLPALHVYNFGQTDLHEIDTSPQTMYFQFRFNNIAAVYDIFCQFYRLNKVYPIKVLIV